MNTPIAALLATEHSRELARSALPGAPVRSEPETPPPRAARVRGRAAAVLRHAAARIEPARG